LISVLTPTIPERRRLLHECRLSVLAQTFPDREHLVLLDEEREGCSATCNTLARAAVGEWLFLLADDDLMLPNCLRAHLSASATSDIVYCPPLVWGEDHRQFWGEPPQIPSTMLIRKTWWHKLDGYSERATHTEDRFLYERAMEEGARFTRIEEPTWVYRLGHGGNKSRARQ
jgi:hypothetical protein